MQYIELQTRGYTVECNTSLQCVSIFIKFRDNNCMNSIDNRI